MESATRSKKTVSNRNSSVRPVSFAFRRIQARELYEPAAEAESPVRLRFRLRLPQLGRSED